MLYLLRISVVFVATLLLIRPTVADEPARQLDFARDVRPILSNVCFSCHGPDESAREAELRLDVREELFAARDAGQVVEPGDPEHSLLYQRITATDPEVRMPPPTAPRQLTEQQVNVLQQWIAEGGQWQEHWAFVAPQSQALPAVQSTEWPQNAIDYFVLARLGREGLAPSPPARKETWIRRVTLDLTGLPATPAEVQAYVNDSAADADQRVVDRLLASPHFGERLAIDWLDAARYADTSGYQNDGPRLMWRWRDWVIDSFNRNQPFDQFTVEQIAGDMLPNATREQIIATGFNRNHRGNSEGGIIPEEFAVEYVVDRVETTFTVWLGLTMGCARCHDHKYDPLQQSEFYQAFAYFNNVPEFGRAIKEGNSPPYVLAPTPQQEQQLNELDALISAAEQQHASMLPDLNRAYEQFVQRRGVQSLRRSDWTIERGLVAQYLFPDTAIAQSSAAKLPFELTFAGGDPQFAPAPIGRAMQCDGTRYADAGDVGNFGYFDKFSLSAWICPADVARGTIVSRMTDAPEGDGYSLELRNGRLQLNLVKRWLDDSLRVESSEMIPANQWTHVAATYDGSRKASGIVLYINGRPTKELMVNLDGLNQTFATVEPLRIGAGGGPDARFRGQIADVRVYNRALPAKALMVIAAAERVEDIYLRPVAERSEAAAAKLRTYFEAVEANQQWRQVADQLQQLRERRQELLERIPTVMVMQESPQTRPTFILDRGQYDRPREQVQPGVPACLPPLPPNSPNNRLAFAYWLVDRERPHPLTARVTVNRYWQMLFGTGLVKTAEDFGIQGEPPSHPELLDWLAVDFVQSGWDVKRLIRQMVLSATYRQSSAVTADLWQRDPENRLLARGPRFRLPAELVRDQALAASGLFVNHIGGPSVKPYQPEGLWKEIATDVEYGQGHGTDLYRRSLYTYWKRTVAPPTMVTFDAFSRETCMLRRSRTNTPLQALALMNDVTFVEAARKLAERSLADCAGSPSDRLELMFQLMTARSPSAEELAVMQRALERNQRRFADDRAAAISLLQMGESRNDPAIDCVELAAYTMVASLLLNFDEVVTKE